MALVECPDCGKRISDQATECNQCGRPMQTARPEADASTEGPRSPNDESSGVGGLRVKLSDDPGVAVGSIGAGVGIVVLVLYSVAAGLVVAGIAVAAGLWIQYGPFRRRKYQGDKS